MLTIDFTGKNAIITGAGSGLAKETALLFADCGANIVAADLNLDAVKETVKDIEAKGRKAFAVQCDVSKMADMEKLFATAKKELGRIDIVINGAGIGPMTNLETATEADFRKILDVNVMSVEFGCKLALQTMKEQGGSGVVINFASISGFMTTRVTPHYSISKAAVLSLNRQYALTGAADGIRFNSICPGMIRTPMWEKGLETLAGGDQSKYDKIWNERIVAPIPMGVPQESIDIAWATAFLASDQARYITGQSLNIDGGQIMH